MYQFAERVRILLVRYLEGKPGPNFGGRYVRGLAAYLGFPIKSGDPYDRDVVLGALVRSVEDFRKRGRRPDLIFATGDIAHSGKAAEYAAATPFFDAICEAAGIEKRRLFVIPGNHDVDRDLGFGLARTLGSREDSDRYFRPGTPKLHFVKLREFVKWHDGYFAGIRTNSETSSCCEPELVEIDGHRIRRAVDQQRAVL